MQLTPGTEHPLKRERKRTWRRVSGRSVASAMVTARRRGPPAAWLRGVDGWAVLTAAGALLMTIKPPAGHHQQLGAKNGALVNAHQARAGTADPYCVTLREGSPRRREERTFCIRS
jgi:hypothetical protein